MQLKLSRERLVGCLEDGVSVLLENEDGSDGSDGYLVEIVSREEHRFWASIIDDENERDDSRLNLKQIEANQGKSCCCKLQFS